MLNIFDRLAATYGHAFTAGGETRHDFTKHPLIAEVMRELAKAHRHAVEWQPIDTAPKDGQWVILFRGNQSTCPVGPDYWLGSDIRQWAKTPYKELPIFWMPMPAPPTPAL